MFDTHCHLNFSQFEESLPNVIHRANLAGVEKFVVPGVDLDSSRGAVDIANAYGQVFAACGLHPAIEDLQEEGFSKSLLNLEELAQSSEKIVAVGEVGLDYYRYKLSSRPQKRLLIEQLRLAAKLGLSVILHNRHASEDLVEVLRDNWQDGFEGSLVFHCCEPNSDILKLASERQLYIGVDGDVTYDKTKADFVKEVPLANLVLETDSPYLVPEPPTGPRAHGAGGYRSKKQFPNEPKNLEMIAAYVANIKQVNIDSFKNKIYVNSLSLFNLNS